MAYKQCWRVCVLFSVAGPVSAPRAALMPPHAEIAQTARPHPAGMGGRGQSKGRTLSNSLWGAARFYTMEDAPMDAVAPVAPTKTAHAPDSDYYSKLKALERQLEFVNLQVRGGGRV